MEKKGLYYATFRLEKHGFKPVMLQGMYQPSDKMSSPEMKIELYEAIHELVRSHLKTDKFKLSFVSMTKIYTDFIYTPGGKVGQGEKEAGNGQKDDA